MHGRGNIVNIGKVSILRWEMLMFELRQKDSLEFYQSIEY